MPYEEYEDRTILEKKQKPKENVTSPYCDFIYYESSQTPGLQLAARIIKPEKSSYILVGTHGWHMSIPEFAYMDQPEPDNHYLRIQVDMRGRAHSDGDPDCNGLELYDVIDAVNYAKKHYSDYILDPDVVYFEAGSGGGGNALAIVGKFPDFFAAATALCGISDYAVWYENDEVGEFRDEMDVWIGCAPVDLPQAYEARSGRHLLHNLHTPMYLAHGETDIRVPAWHSRKYKEEADQLGKGHLVQYDELKGVGTREHWGNATEVQMKEVAKASERNRMQHRKPIDLEPQGRLVVAGYVVTKHFSVHLDSLSKVAIVDYDLNKGYFSVTGEGVDHYTIQKYRSI